MQGMQIGRMVCWLEVIGKCNTEALRLTFTHYLQLFTSFSDKLVFVNGGGFRRGGGVVVRHLIG